MEQSGQEPPWWRMRGVPTLFRAWAMLEQTGYLCCFLQRLGTATVLIRVKVGGVKRLTM